jgi:hypothetical protein
MSNKIILTPIWTYGIILWGSASTSNIEILERFQSKALRTITDAPWYVPNVILRQDLRLKRKSDVSAFNTAPACRHIPTASQFILRNHQNTGDWNDTCQPI